MKIIRWLLNRTRSYINYGQDQFNVENFYGSLFFQQPEAARPVKERDLLNSVKEEVGSRLAPSLHDMNLMPQSMQTQSEQVERLSDAEVKSGSKPAETLSSTRIREVFDRPEVAGKLLILGNPGVGKSTAMLTLAESLIDKAIKDITYPIPVILNLSSWKGIPQLISTWLIEELNSIYKVPRNLGEQWIKDKKLLPLLDGLDEVKLAHQAACARALNDWLESEFPPPHLVVCSRQEDYEKVVRGRWQDTEALEEEIDNPQEETCLRLKEAILLKTLTDEQIKEYLEKVELTDLWQMLQQDVVVNNTNTSTREFNLLELMRTPLFLSTLVFIFFENNLNSQERQKLISSITQPQHLFDAYWNQAINRPLIRNPEEKKKGIKSRTYGKRQPPNKRQTRKWLVYLARQLQQELQTEFLIEKMQPDWLSETEKRDYELAVRLMVGLIAGLTAGLYLGGWTHEPLLLLFAILSGAVTGGISHILSPRLGHLSEFYSRLRASALYGLSFSIGTYVLGYAALLPLEEKRILFVLTGIGVGAVFLALSPQDIKPLDQIKFSLRRTIKFTGSTLLLGLISVGCRFIVQPGFYSKYPTYILYELFSFLLVGVLAGSSLGREAKIDWKKYPNQGIWITWKYAVIWFVIGAFTSGIFTVVRDGPDEVRATGIALTVGLLASLVGSNNSGIVCIQHFILRLTLSLKDRVPWNYACFLDYCKERNLLQRVGGRYRFMHKLLQEHFAGMPIDTRVNRE